MFVGACLDLGVPFASLTASLATLGLTSFEVTLSRFFAGAIGASKFDVVVSGTQPQRSFAQVKELILKSQLELRVQTRAVRIFDHLASAEGEVHRIPKEQVHFHEVGAVDSICDIVGAAFCLEYLGAELVTGPLPLGRGTTLCQHGRIPLPAPATLLCLRGLPTVDSGIEQELVTPTGAAILGSESHPSNGWPGLVVERVGWGAGTRRIPGAVNALRLVLGSKTATLAPPRSNAEPCWLLETNIDDATGEQIAHVVQRLLQDGALDAWTIPATMKKGRPGVVLSALCKEQAIEGVRQCILTESSAIGLRIREVQRSELHRRTIHVQTDFGSVRVKVSDGAAASMRHVKPEFEDCRRIAEDKGVPLRVVSDAAQSAARDQLSDLPGEL